MKLFFFEGNWNVEKKTGTLGYMLSLNGLAQSIYSRALPEVEAEKGHPRT